MRRKLSDIRLQLRALHLGGRWFRRVMLEEEPEAREDEAASPLLDEAMDHAQRGPVMPHLGVLDDEEEDVHVV